jgi:hypothetical protein
MNVKFCASLALTVIFLGAAAAGAEPEAASATPAKPLNRFVEGTKDFFRSPFKRHPHSSPSPSPDATSVKANPGEAKTATDSKVTRASWTSAPQPARTPRNPPRTLTEYMAQERP